MRERSGEDSVTPMLGCAPSLGQGEPVHQMADDDRYSHTHRRHMALPRLLSGGCAFLTARSRSAATLLPRR